MMIKLHHLTSGEPYWLNSDWIVSIVRGQDNITKVWVRGDEFSGRVKETPEEIIKLIERK